MPELRQDREELERLEAKLSRMIQDDRMDEASLARQIDRVEMARANGNKTRSLMLLRMYRVLTREQRTRFDQLSKQWAASAGSPGPAVPPAAKPGTSQPQGNRPAPSDSQRRPDSGRRSYRGTAMKQCQLIGCTAVLVALVAGATSGAARKSPKTRIKELIREAAKTARTGPGTVARAGARARGRPSR